MLLTRAIKSALVNVTCGGAPAYVWPGGGITVMADVLRMPMKLGALADHPALRNYVDRLCARPAFVKAHRDQIAHFESADAARNNGQS